MCVCVFVCLCRLYSIPFELFAKQFLHFKTIFFQILLIYWLKFYFVSFSLPSPIPFSFALVVGFLYLETIQFQSYCFFISVFDIYPHYCVSGIALKWKYKISIVVCRLHCPTLNGFSAVIQHIMVALWNMNAITITNLMDREEEFVWRMKLGVVWHQSVNVSLDLFCFVFSSPLARICERREN